MSSAIARPRPTLRRLTILSLFVATTLVAPGQSLRAATATVPPKKSTITVAPTLTQQPASLVVVGGQSATFSIAVADPTGVIYQWSRNGVAMAGATTSTLVLPAVALSDSGASYAATATNSAGVARSSVARLTVNARAAQIASADRPYSDQSPWNARPSRFTFGPETVPQSSYYPTVAAGAWSLGVFVAAATDPAVDVLPAVGQSTIYIADALAGAAKVTIPHWPAGTTPASGADGHADIIDVAANRIHSFYQLRLVNGQWHAAEYAWAPLDGSGWGTPARPMQGPRATGVPASAGLIRVKELVDGLPSYHHALTMSLTFNALAASPSYVFPATASDGNTSTPNTGTIPEGSLMMLPATFDTSSITDPRLLKIVRTLQSYGAYVVDRNYGTPYEIYVENGSNFNLMPSGWDSNIAAALDLIRAGLHRVSQVTEWVDANGAVFVPNTRLNILSMRGPWGVTRGTTPGVFDSWQQAVVFPGNGQAVAQTNWSGLGFMSVAWGAPRAAQSFTIKVAGTDGATLRLDLYSGSTIVFTTGSLPDGASLTFAWPAGAIKPIVSVASGAQGGGRISATVTATP